MTPWGGSPSWTSSSPLQPCVSGETGDKLYFSISAQRNPPPHAGAMTVAKNYTKDLGASTEFVALVWIQSSSNPHSFQCDL